MKPFKTIRNSTVTGRFRINVASNGAFAVYCIMMNIWYTPFLIKNLGIVAYGYVPLAMQLTMYLAVFTGGITTAVGRFLSIDITKKDDKKINATINTSFFGLSGMAGLLIPFLMLFIILIPRIFVVPQNLIPHVRLLFSGIFLAFITTTIESSLKIIPFSSERHDFSALTEAVRITSRMLITVLLFAVIAPVMPFVGYSSFFAALLSLFISFIISKRLMPQLELSPRLFSITRFYEMWKLTFWSVVTQAGALLFWYSDLTIVNRVFGPAAGGEYGTILVFSILLRTGSDTLAKTLAPVVFGRFALGDNKGMINIATRSVRLQGILMALPVGLICGFARPVLHIWLGTEFEHLDNLLRAAVFHLSVNLAAVPLFILAQGYGAIKIPAIVTASSGILNAVLAIYVSRVSGLGLISVPLTAAVILLIKNTVFTPMFTARLLNVSNRVFIVPILLSGAAALAVSFSGDAYCRIIEVRSFPALAVGTAAVASIYLSVLWLFILSVDDKTFIMRILGFRNAKNKY